MSEWSLYNTILNSNLCNSVCPIYFVKMGDGICVNAVYMILLKWWLCMFECFLYDIIKWKLVYVWMLLILYY
jgi:hypothetical protein